MSVGTPSTNVSPSADELRPFNVHHKHHQQQQHGIAASRLTAAESAATKHHYMMAIGAGPVAVSPQALAEFLAGLNVAAIFSDVVIDDFLRRITAGDAPQSQPRTLTLSGALELVAGCKAAYEASGLDPDREDARNALVALREASAASPMSPLVTHAHEGPGGAAAVASESFTQSVPTPRASNERRCHEMARAAHATMALEPHAVEQVLLECSRPRATGANIDYSTSFDATYEAMKLVPRQPSREAIAAMRRLGATYDKDADDWVVRLAAISSEVSLPNSFLVDEGLAITDSITASQFERLLITLRRAENRSPNQSATKATEGRDGGMSSSHAGHSTVGSSLANLLVQAATDDEQAGEKAPGTELLRRRLEQTEDRHRNRISPKRITQPLRETATASMHRHAQQSSQPLVLKPTLKYALRDVREFQIRALQDLTLEIDDEVHTQPSSPLSARKGPASRSPPKTSRNARPVSASDRGFATARLQSSTARAPSNHAPSGLSGAQLRAGLHRITSSGLPHYRTEPFVDLPMIRKLQTEASLTQARPASPRLAEEDMLDVHTPRSERYPDDSPRMLGGTVSPDSNMRVVYIVGGDGKRQKHYLVPAPQTPASQRGGGSPAPPTVGRPASGTGRTSSCLRGSRASSRLSPSPPASGGAYVYGGPRTQADAAEDVQRRIDDADDILPDELLVEEMRMRRAVRFIQRQMRHWMARLKSRCALELQRFGRGMLRRRYVGLIPVTIRREGERKVRTTRAMMLLLRLQRVGRGLVDRKALGMAQAGSAERDAVNAFATACGFQRVAWSQAVPACPAMETLRFREKRRMLEQEEPRWRDNDEYAEDVRVGGDEEVALFANSFGDSVANKSATATMPHPVAA
jgi:hypothetical protein